MIVYEDRAVAFIDIMGFKPLVRNSAQDPSTLEKLSRLISLLEQAVPLLNAQISKDVPPELIPTHTYISDCIILSAPLKSSQDGHTLYDGLDVVCMRAIQLTHFFLNEGYLIRGGISVGKAWHTGENIVGPAYQEAYLLEFEGNEPCIVLSEAACKIPSFTTRVRVEHNDKVFVNGLNGNYLPEQYEYDGINSVYAKYKLMVDDMIHHGNLPPDPLSKWTWFKSYLEAEASESNQWEAV